MWLVVPVYIVLEYRYAVNRYILVFDYEYTTVLDTGRNVKYNAHVKWVIIWPGAKAISNC